MDDIECADFPVFPQIIPKVNRVIAIGDVHGDFDYLIHLLKIARVIDNKNKWVGGKTYVVQLGDQIDSCRMNYNSCDNPKTTPNDKAEDIKIIKYLDNLNIEAREHDGAVISLLGNHEIMNIIGNMTYVSYKNIAQSNGLQNRVKNFSKDGEIGRKLICTHPSAVIIGTNLFVHAGILLSITKSIPKFKHILNITMNAEIENLTPKESVNFIINKILNGTIKKEVLYKIYSSEPSDQTKLKSALIGKNKKEIINNLMNNKNILSNLIKVSDEIKKILRQTISFDNIENLHAIEVVNIIVRKWLLQKLDKSYEIEEKTFDVEEKTQSIFWNRFLGIVPDEKCFKEIDKKKIKPEESNITKITENTRIPHKEISNNPTNPENPKINTNQICEENKIVMKFLNVDNMIIGHTPQFISLALAGINAGCDCSVLRTDIGGSNAFNIYDATYAKTKDTTKQVIKQRTPQIVEILDDTNHRILYDEKPYMTGGKLYDLFKNYYFTN